MPGLSLTTRLRDFFLDLSVPMWLKLLHLFILIDAKTTKAKNGYTIYYQNPGLIKRFRIYGPNGKTILWEPSLESIQKSIRILIDMGFILQRTVSTNGERRMKLNRAKILEYIKQNSIETDVYKKYTIKSRERKLVRRKIITLAEYITQARTTQNEQFKRYLEYQQRKYGYDITVPDVELFDIDFDFDQFITPAELEYYRQMKKYGSVLDALEARLPDTIS